MCMPKVGPTKEQKELQREQAESIKAEKKRVQTEKKRVQGEEVKAESIKRGGATTSTALFGGRSGFGGGTGGSMFSSRIS